MDSSSVGSGGQSIVKLCVRDPVAVLYAALIRMRPGTANDESESSKCTQAQAATDHM